MSQITNEVKNQIKKRRTFAARLVSDSFIPNKYRRIVPRDETPPADTLLGVKNTLMLTASTNVPNNIPICSLRTLLFMIHLQNGSLYIVYHKQP